MIISYPDKRCLGRLSDITFYWRTLISRDREKETEKAESEREIEKERKTERESVRERNC